MKAKYYTRNNNVDATRSTMQKRVNSLHRQLTNQMEAAHRKNRKMNQYKGFIFRLIATGVIPKSEFKNFMSWKKESPQRT